MSKHDPDKHKVLADELAKRARRLAAEQGIDATPRTGNGTATPHHVDQPLEAVLAYLRRFVAYPSEHAAVAHALWVVHTHLMECWDSTPRIAFLSPEPGSGKSRALEASELLVPHPICAVNVSVAFMFRRIGDEEARPTILYDEIDTVFHAKASGAAEDIRGLLNAGHRRAATVGRCEVHGKRIVPVETSAYCAVALAGLGDLPDTLLSRSVIVRMRRRAPHEHVEPYRRREAQAEADELREWVAAWCASVADLATVSRPAFPASVADRDADVWESLLAIADLAGGDWPVRARAAAEALVAEAKSKSPSLGVRLLTDLHRVFAGRDFVATDELVKTLCSMEESPWADLRGKPLDARSLARGLQPYGVESAQRRFGDARVRGYAAADLADAWSRYVCLHYAAPVTAVTAVTPPAAAAAPGTDVTDVTAPGYERQTGAELAHLLALARRPRDEGGLGWTDADAAETLADFGGDEAAAVAALRDLLGGAA
jgi:hypothetical protein